MANLGSIGRGLLNLRTSYISPGGGSGTWQQIYPKVAVDMNAVKAAGGGGGGGGGTGQSGGGVCVF